MSERLSKRHQNHELDIKLQTAMWKKSTRGNEHEYVLELDCPDLVHEVQKKMHEEGVKQKFFPYPFK